MKTLKQRIASGVLAGTLALSLAVPAFASNTKITGTYKEVTIAVTVPATGTATINPYGLAVKYGDSSIIGHQIVTAPLAIVNMSEMDLKVNATVTGEVKGNFKFATESTAAVEDDPDTADVDESKPAPTTNSAFVYLEMQAGDNSNNWLKADGTAVDETKLNAAAANWEVGKYTIPEADEGAEPNTTDPTKVIVGTKAASSEKPLATLTKATTTGTGDSAVTKPAVDGVAMFRLSGDCVKAPKTAWTKADGFTATIAFTFEPEV